MMKDTEMQLDTVEIVRGRLADGRTIADSDVHKLVAEIDRLRENITLLDELWHEYHDACVLQVEENDRLKESLSIADAACRTYWGWEYGHDLDDDIPNSSLLVKWRHDYVKRK